MTDIFILMFCLGAILVVAHFRSVYKSSNPQNVADMSWFRTVVVRWRTGTNISTNSALAEEEESKGVLDAAKVESRHAKDVAEAEHGLEMKQFDVSHAGLDNQATVFEAATAKGETPATNQEKNLHGFKVDKEIEKITKVEAHRVLMEFRTQMNTIRAILAYQHLSFDQFDEIFGRLSKLIMAEARIRVSDLAPQVKEELLGLITEAKEMYREVLHALKDRFLQVGNGHPTRGTEAFGSVPGGFAGNPETGVEDKLPVNLAWDWDREGDTQAGGMGTPPHNRDDWRGEE